mmetsp:Transcript_9739/g.21959  ORF Transcript_9739/g.21959 Transcript_9739/m.21959 type:complete len:177 (+) Transcript_9739:72-602(+)
MSAITRIFNLLLLFAATAHANVHSSGMLEGTQQRFKFDALRALQSDAPTVCTDESAQVEACDGGFNPDNWVECSFCLGEGFSSAKEVILSSDVEVDPNDPNNLAPICNAIKSSNYCSDLHKCIDDNCPDVCKIPMKTMYSCAMKESNCDIECSPGFKAKATTAVVTITAFLFLLNI